MGKENWNEEEDAACFYLYIKHGRKQLDKNMPEVIKLAIAIGRTPSAISYKSANFRYIDSNSDGKGFKHFSGMDKKVLLKYSNMLDEAEAIYKRIISNSL